MIIPHGFGAVWIHAHEILLQVAGKCIQHITMEKVCVLQILKSGSHTCRKEVLTTSCLNLWSYMRKNTEPVVCAEALCPPFCIWLTSIKSVNSPATSTPTGSVGDFLSCAVGP